MGGLWSDRPQFKMVSIMPGMETSAPLRTETSKRLTQLCHAADHQGCLAQMGPFPYTPGSEMLTAIAHSKQPAFVVILDGIQDSFNFGAIARSAEALGADAIIIAERGQVGVNSQVARSSAGAIVRLPIVRVADLVQFCGDLRWRGLRLIAACEKASDACWRCDLRPPTAVILGNENQGIRPELLELCSATVRVPQQGEIGSLNVAAAAAAICYEVQRQRAPSQTAKGEVGHST